MKLRGQNLKRVHELALYFLGEVPKIVGSAGFCRELLPFPHLLVCTDIIPTIRVRQNSVGNAVISCGLCRWMRGAHIEAAWCGFLGAHQTWPALDPVIQKIPCSVRSGVMATIATELPWETRGWGMLERKKKETKWRTRNVRCEEGRNGGVVGMGSTLAFTQGWCDLRRMPLSLCS